MVSNFLDSFIPNSLPAGFREHISLTAGVLVPSLDIESVYYLEKVEGRTGENNNS